MKIANILKKLHENKTTLQINRSRLFIYIYFFYNDCFHDFHVFYVRGTYFLYSSYFLLIYQSQFISVVQGSLGHFDELTTFSQLSLSAANLLILISFL